MQRVTKRRVRRCTAALIVVSVSVPAAVASLAASPPKIDGSASAPDLAPAERLVKSPVYCGEVEPARFGYDPFYQHHCSADGLDVLASSDVDPAAVKRTAEIAVAMIGHRPDVVQEMIARGVRIGVIGVDEVTSDMPEYRDIYTLFPGTDWDTRARGLGATPGIPLSSVGEENILCLPGDPYVGSSIMAHEFAHTIDIMGLDFVDPAFGVRVGNAYANARLNGLWDNTYAGSNPTEYWAETVMSYFDANIAGPAGGDGVHNDIDTRAELAVYDPLMFAIVDGVFRAAEPLRLCNG